MGIVEQHLHQMIALYERVGQAGGAIEKFVIKHGKVYAPGPDTYSRHRGPQGECYANAARLAQAHDSYTYVEGYVTIFDIPIGHAWIVDDKGSLIDPTLAEGTGFERVGEYFGVEFGTGYLVKSILTNRRYGLLDGYYNRKTIVPLIEGRANFKPKERK